MTRKGSSRGLVLRPSFGSPPADPVAFAIKQHKRTYEAWVHARDQYFELHELFDPEWDLEEPDIVHDEMMDFYGSAASSEIERYALAQAASRRAAEMEHSAWLQLQAVPLNTKEQLDRWMGYMHRYACIGEDQVPEVTLGFAMRRIGAMAAEHMEA